MSSGGAAAVDSRRLGVKTVKGAQYNAREVLNHLVDT